MSRLKLVLLALGIGVGAVAFTKLAFALWSYYLFDGVRYQWSGDRSGAKIGLGLVLLASPLLISIACIAAHLVGRRSPSPRAPAHSSDRGS
jgi:hypothetical protein